MAAKKRAKAKPRKRAGRFLRAQTDGLRLVNRLAFAILILMGCVAVALLAVPQVRELKRLEQEHAQSLARERETMARKDRRSRELAALKSDPEYLEIVARDRLNWYDPAAGETPVRVIRAGE